MSAVVAHEVKNPLAGISGALQVVAARLPADSRDCAILDDIQERIGALNRMVQDLLVFARPRDPVLVPSALRAAVHGAVAAMKHDPALAELEVRVRGSSLTARPSAGGGTVLTLTFRADAPAA